MMCFGIRLKELRKRKGISQSELGKVLNISGRIIGYYESGMRFPKSEIILMAIADYFNVSIDYLLGHSEPIHNIDLDGLPAEAVEKIQEYIGLIKLKYKFK